MNRNMSHYIQHSSIQRWQVFLKEMFITSSDFSCNTAVKTMTAHLNGETSNLPPRNNPPMGSTNKAPECSPSDDNLSNSIKMDPKGWHKVLLCVESNNIAVEGQMLHLSPGPLRILWSAPMTSTFKEATEKVASSGSRGIVCDDSNKKTCVHHLLNTIFSHSKTLEQGFVLDPNSGKEKVLFCCPWINSKTRKNTFSIPSCAELNNLEEELTCCICYNLYEDPRVLPCSHTFCKNCLESVVQASSNYSIWRPIRIPLKCPTCRSVAEIPPGGIGTLPANFALRAIIEKYSKEDHQHVSTCPEHSQQPLNVYCLSDRKLVCGMCLTIGQHQGHPIGDLQSAYVKERETPCKLMELLSDKQWTRICELIDNLEEQKSESVRKVKEQKKLAVQYFKKISDSVEQKKHDLLSALNEVNSRIVAEYETQIEKMKEIQEEQLDLLSLCSSIQEEESPLVFLEKVNEIRQRVKTLRKQKLLPVHHVELYPQMEEVLKCQWSKTEIGAIDKLIIPKIELCSKEKIETQSNPKNKRHVFDRLNLLVTAIFLFIFTILLIILTDSTVLFPVLNETRLIYITEIMQSLVDFSGTKLQATRSSLYCISDVLLEFKSYVVSYITGIYENVTGLRVH